MSRSDGTDRYTYPGSDVLINKPGITDPLALDAFAADATAIQMLDISLILKALNKSKSMQR